MSAPAAANEPVQAPFFRSHNRVIGLAYASILLGIAAFFGTQLLRSMEREIVLIEGEVERHAMLLEFALRSSADHVEALRMAASSDNFDSATRRRRCLATGRDALPLELREGGEGFHMDGLSQPDSAGNLVGLGSLSGRSPLFYCDLLAALALNPTLTSLPFILPGAARMRFLSAQRFHLVAPWEPASQVPFLDSDYRAPVWTLALPQNNPDRHKYWAPVIFGGQQLGLLAPVAAPVYDQDRLIGIVSIDTSLDYLNRMNSLFGYPLGTVFVVDQRGAVIAHPGVFADPLAVRTPATLAQVMPSDMEPSLKTLHALPNRKATRAGAQLVVRHRFDAAPWDLVYAVPRAELWKRILLDRGTGMLILLAGLALLMLVTWWISTRLFVDPAAKLVTHLSAESSSRAQPIPKVPAAWQPWFEAITRAFRESFQLASLRREIDIAADLQQALLPRSWPTHPGYSLYGRMRPAGEVGGDFYDHFPRAGGKHALLVADVSGKGISAGLFAMMAKALLRSLATRADTRLGGLLAEVNRDLCADNENSMFVTALVADYDPISGLLRYANAGHPPALHIRLDGASQWLPVTGGVILGFQDDLGYEENQIFLLPGDTVLLFTDGVTEASNSAGAQFGQEGLRGLFAQHPPLSARDAVDTLLAALARHAAGMPAADDITCIALHCHATGSGAVAAQAPASPDEQGKDRDEAA